MIFSAIGLERNGELCECCCQHSARKTMKRLYNLVNYSISVAQSLISPECHCAIYVVTFSQYIHFILLLACLRGLQEGSDYTYNAHPATCICTTSSRFIVRPPRSTRSSSLVALARPLTSSSLRTTDRSFRYACVTLSLESTHCFSPSTQFLCLCLTSSRACHILCLC